MRGRPTTFWGKLQRDESDTVVAWHPLIDHCADVAACAEALLRQTLLGRRLAALGGQEELDEAQIQRLAALAAFHDVGKFNLGFQNKAKPQGTPTAGHVGEVAALFDSVAAVGDRFVEAVGAEAWAAWADVEAVQELFFASICHHGRPVVTGQPVVAWIWRAAEGLDPFKGLRELAEQVRRWFPLAFAPGGAPLPAAPAFQHAFSGLVMLSDWLGSDTRVFRYTELGETDRMDFARHGARSLLQGMGLEPGPGRTSLGPEAPLFADVFGFSPKGAQVHIAGWTVPPAAASLTLLEAETGAGKTEAALQRYLHLFHQGHVDGMYFALPTRTAATQIYRRVVRAVEAAFPDAETRPPVILAVPGYLETDGVEGKRDPLLGPFEVLWNDSDSERFRYRAWAAENSKRYLAAPVAVGTIDQVLLGSLRVSHAHLRATSLLRQLLVVDEVHASDLYMTRLLEAAVDRHLGAGGHAFLMSATLGSVAAHRYFDPKGREAPPALEDAIAAPFPTIRHREGSGQTVTQPIPPPVVGKRVEVEAWPGIDAPGKVVERAVKAARRGAKVLILRNTVHDCLETQEALEHALGNDDEVLLRCKGVAAPHHARYSTVDRTALDDAIEAALGKERESGGKIAVATQTVQQSLDLDADWLITDLCPIDVLLQRIGRLHRHERVRPEGFETARTSILVPAERDLGAAIRKSGKAFGKHGLGSVYDDLRILEATWRQVEQRPVWKIPADNRALVEAATHPDALAAIVAELGPPWDAHRDHILGGHAAERSLAHYAMVAWSRPFGEQPFPATKDSDERIATRLGEGDRRVVFADPLPGPFRQPVTELRLPAHFARDIPIDAEPEAVEASRGTIRFVFGGKPFLYDRLGLRPFIPVTEDDLADA